VCDNCVITQIKQSGLIRQFPDRFLAGRDLRPKLGVQILRGFRKFMLTHRPEDQRLIHPHHPLIARRRVLGGGNG
jgi:hypothetical protein